MLYFVKRKQERILPMFPFIGAASIAIAFAQLGAMSVRIGVLTSSLYAMVLISIALALLVLSMARHRA